MVNVVVSLHSMLSSPCQCVSAALNGTRWLSHHSGRQPKTRVKPEAAITVFELLMMGGVSPETC